MVRKSLSSSALLDAENPFLLKARCITRLFPHRRVHSRTGGGPCRPCGLVQQWLTQLQTHGYHLGACKELRGDGAEAATETFNTYMHTSSLPPFVLQVPSAALPADLEGIQVNIPLVVQPSTY